MEYLISSVEKISAELNELPQNIVKQVSEAIEHFNAMDLATATESHILEVLDFLSDAYFLNSAPVVEAIEPWRTRPTKPNEILQHSDQLGYCPPEKARMQRFNKDFEAVIYTSSIPEATFAECRLKDGDFFHVIQYRVQPSPDLQLLHIGGFDALRRKDSSDVIFGRQLESVAEKIAALRDDVKMAVSLVDSFLFDRLSRKDETEYLVTSAISKEFMAAPGCAGLVFPSVAYRGAVNFVFKPEAYDNFIRPTSVRVGRVARCLGYGAYYYVTTVEAPIPNFPGEIMWPVSEKWADELNEAHERKLARYRAD
jgi:hypothetical protein